MIPEILETIIGATLAARSERSHIDTIDEQHYEEYTCTKCGIWNERLGDTQYTGCACHET